MDRLITLKSSEEFGQVYRQGRSYYHPLMGMIVLKNPDQAGRIGISVSKKVGNSVIRHRIRRLIKESFRHHISEWPEARYVFVARREAAGKSFRDIESAMLALGKKAGLFAAGEDPVQKPL